MVPPKINYVNNNKLIVINQNGKIRQLFTAFKVQVLKDTNHFKEKSWAGWLFKKLYSIHNTSYFIPPTLFYLPSPPNNINMKILFLTVGKAHEPHVKEGIELFTKRLSNYFPVQWQIVPMPKNAASLSETDLKQKEGEIIVSLLKKEDYLVLLDERGKLINSEGLATMLQQRANESVKSLVFLIGGAYGVSDEVMKRAQYSWSLSPLVFPHQLVRLILAEQVYRACTILRNEKYHHS